jgi:hypothetical protein
MVIYKVSYWQLLVYFRLSWRLLTDANSVRGLLHGVDVDEVVDISETYAISMFSVDPEYVAHNYTL